MPIMVLTTTDSREKAEEMAEKLVSRGTVACAQIVPVKSFYTWKGRTEKTQEWLVIMKTAKDFETVKKEIKKIHNYELPEIISVQITAENDYLEWLRSCAEKTP
ncbi:MAG: divalent-cation tolerance protein CutA [Candidatus Micrarchaeota archaeon]|nr:divalent-cation tolerance protein CutA [Candidatus Micrarchaeota archaeon]